MESSSPTTSKSFSIDAILQKNTTVAKPDDSTEAKNSDSTSASSTVSETFEKTLDDKAASPVPQPPPPQPQALSVLPNPMMQMPHAPSPLYSNPLLLESLAIRQRMIQNQLLQRNFDAQMRLINSQMYPTAHPLPPKLAD